MCVMEREGGRCAVLAPPVDSYGPLPVHTGLQKERGTLRFPDLSQPSPLCAACLHITADSGARRRRLQRRRNAPGVLKSRIHLIEPASSRIHLDPDKVSTSTRTQVSSRCFSHMLGTRPRAAAAAAPPLRLPGQASERCLAQAENEASFSA